MEAIVCLSFLGLRGIPSQVAVDEQSGSSFRPSCHLIKGGLETRVSMAAIEHKKWSYCNI